MSNENADHLVEDERQRAGRIMWQSVSLESFIQTILSVAADGPEGGASVGITIILGGNLISGHAISFSQYLSEFADTVESHGLNIVSSEGKITRHSSEVISKRYREVRDGITRAGAGMLETGMLFLKDAQVLTNAGLQPTGGFLLAVEKDQIQGWALGKLGQNSP